MVISIQQNKPENIKRLQAQRQIYSDVKFWMVSIVIVGVILPILAFLVNLILNELKFDNFYIDYLPAFIGCISLIYVEVGNRYLKGMRESAAKIQEKFDTCVFKLPWDSIGVGKEPDPELIFKKSQKFLRKNPEYRGFINWYTAKAASFRYPEAIVFCQQQNICWDKSLREKIIYIAYIALIIFLMIIFVFGIYNNFTLGSFLKDVVFVLAPVFLFIYKIISEQKESINKINQLSDINNELVNKIVTAYFCNHNEELLGQARQLQTAIYNHRKSARPVPDWLHNMSKKNYEEESAKRMEQYLEDNS